MPLRAQARRIMPRGRPAGFRSPANMPHAQRQGPRPGMLPHIGPREHRGPNLVQRAAFLAGEQVRRQKEQTERRENPYDKQERHRDSKKTDWLNRETGILIREATEVLRGEDHRGNKRRFPSSEKIEALKILTENASPEHFEFLMEALQKESDPEMKKRILETIVNIGFTGYYGPAEETLQALQQNPKLDQRTKYFVNKAIQILAERRKRETGK
ncbi:MAG: hypothetical protein Q7S92_06000 [Candidatus Diapherotrites archaeon]|nr:hypothetical protein [Candidatus Diapherotrites archaeon]